MGTFFEAEIRVAESRRDSAETWLDWARKETARLEKIYSRHDPESEISRLNAWAAGEVGTETSISKELESILLLAVALNTETSGRFDPSIGPLVELWTEAARRGSAPNASELARARALVGLDGFVSTARGRVELRREGTRLDLDGFSKGFVLDHLREDFERAFPDTPALFSLGQSSVVAIGSPAATEAGWRLRLRSRAGEPAFLGDLVLRDEALSVSSSLGSVLEIDGETYSHVLDARTGRPIRSRSEAVVVGPSAAAADAWSTALLVAPLESDGADLPARGFEARIEFEGGGGLSTPGWREAAGIASEGSRTGS
jgi:thiamine biosynthesis lipoprotein